MSDARDLFEPEPGAGTAALLHEVALIRLTLEAIRTDLEEIGEDVRRIGKDLEAFLAAPAAPQGPLDAPPPVAGAPLAAGGGASYPGFPASFRLGGGARTGGGR